MRDSDGQTTFGELLLGYRRAAGLSQAGLAERSGISVRALRELEQGRARAAQRRSAEVLADAFELGAEEREEFLRVAEQGRRRRPAVSAAGSAEMPPLPSHPVGRVADLAELQRLLQANPTVAIVGQPGVGKTVLAAYAAHLRREDFPDGCLAVDLRGMDELPLPAEVVFDRLLQALGVGPGEVPAVVDEQSSRYRALLEKRKVLVLLDNAASEAQVRPFLAAAPGCRTLVTCRRTLAGLEGVRWLHLEPFDDGDAEALLEAVVGADRVRAEPGVAGELIELCGNLPLALRIAANRLASRPHWTLRYLVGQLRDERTRLSSLSAGDLQVRSAFEVSYRGLSPEGRMLFRRLAAMPGADFGVELTQVVGSLTESEAFGQLDELVDASMVLAGPAEGRFRFHDLLRLFARERWEAEHDEADRALTTEAVVEHLLDMAIAAGRRFSPEEPANEVFDTLDEARSWLEQERSSWLAAFRQAVRTGWHSEVLTLAQAMHWYSDDRWQVVEWVEVFGAGVEAARALGDVTAEAQQLNFLGWAHSMVADTKAALEQHLLALGRAEVAGDRLERMWALAYASYFEYSQVDRATAMEHARESVELAASYDFWAVQLPVRYRFGALLLLDGQHEQALALKEALHEEAVRRGQAGEETKSRNRLTAILVEGMARCLHAMGRCDQAVPLFARSRVMQQEVGATGLAADAALWEGRCCIDAGALDEARELLEYAWTVFDEMAMPTRCANVEIELARIS
ncbi:NB-ARC domain-containing protein [Lentzea sp. NPDC042327]|uniref:ATP-binding protein n=1 Tax=Lentzea sp. NPDC042327 TaxID=3154801 RepID=UPI0033D0947E